VSTGLPTTTGRWSFESPIAASACLLDRQANVGIQRAEAIQFVGDQLLKLETGHRRESAQKALHRVDLRLSDGRAAVTVDQAAQSAPTTDMCRAGDYIRLAISTVRPSRAA
jgi:hypothetical protein